MFPTALATSYRCNTKSPLDLRAVLTPRVALLVCLFLSLATNAVAAEKVTFQQHVMPIFREHCQACHSQDDASAGLALDNYNATLAGGAGGEVLASADSSGSRLWKLVTHAEEPVMPPGDKLPDDQLAVIKAWIDGGLLKDASSKPKPSAKPAIAEVAVDPTGRPQGEPAMPEGLFRQPVLTALHAGPVVSLAASRWAPLVVTPWQRQVSFYHTESLKLLGIVPYVEGLPQVVRFSRDGSLLLVAGGRNGAKGNASLYDVKTGARLTTIGDEMDIVLAADISPDNRMVAIGGPKKKVRAYHVANGDKAYELAKHTDWITALAFSPDGKFIATGDRAAGLRTWDAQAGHERSDLRGHTGPITAIAWRSDSSVMASTSEDGSLRMWNQEGKQIKSSGAHGGGALSVAFAPDGRLVTAGHDQMIKLWKPDGNHLLDLFRMEDASLAAVFVSEGKQVLASDYAGDVRLIDVESRKTVTNFAPNPPTLQDRLANVATKLASAESQQKQASDAAESAVATLAEGRKTHEVHQTRLKQAEQDLVTSQQSKEEHTASAADGDSVLAKAEELLASLNKKVAQTQQALNQSKEQDISKLEEAQRAEAEKKTAELEIQHGESQAALAAASAVHEKAKKMRDAAHQRLKDAETKLGQSEKLLAETRNQQAGLPDLAALTKTRDQAQATAHQAGELVMQFTQSRDALTTELQAFTGAIAKLTKDAQEKAARQTTLAQQLGATESEQSAAAAAVDQQTEKISLLESQIKQLQQQLQSLREQKVELSGALDEHNQRLAETQQKLSETQQTAQIADALLRDFTAAQTLREAYADQAE